METAAELLRQGRRDELWRKYCGFLDLNLREFMDVQERLLMEQIELLSQCELGRKLLGHRVPASAAEFSASVPLTTYADYLPYLDKRQEDVLPTEVCEWARTSGRSSEHGFKWVPYSREMVNKVGEFAVAAFLLASCSGRGDVRLEPGDTCLYTLAPPPYFSGAAIARGVVEQLDPVFIPPLEVGNKMEFGERIREGFKLGLTSGIDLFYGISSVLVAIGEQFQKRSGEFKFSREMLDPRLIYRLLRGVVRSKLAGRPLLPKDLWSVKSIVAGGMDTAVFKDTIEVFWGRQPLEGYGGTEIGGVALQAWNFKGMTFLPDFSFLEFVPEEDFYRSQEDPDSEISVLRLDEVDLGIYELVVTNFHGGVFTRYRTGDLVEIVSLSDEEIGVNTPQMVFHARADGVIDMGNFARLSEKVIWGAVEESGISYVDWTVRKEYVEEKPVLHLYLEARDQVEDGDAKTLIHQKLKEKDPGYADMEDMLGFDPLKVTLLPSGAFARYMQERRAAGADLAHVKPPHINPSDRTLRRLMGM